MRPNFIPKGIKNRWKIRCQKQIEPYAKNMKKWRAKTLKICGFPLEKPVFWKIQRSQKQARKVSKNYEKSSNIHPQNDEKSTQNRCWKKWWKNHEKWAKIEPKWVPKSKKIQEKTQQKSMRKSDGKRELPETPPRWPVNTARRPPGGRGVYCVSQNISEYLFL